MPKEGTLVLGMSTIVIQKRWCLKRTLQRTMMTYHFKKEDLLIISAWMLVMKTLEVSMVQGPSKQPCLAVNHHICIWTIWMS